MFTLFVVFRRTYRKQRTAKNGKSVLDLYTFFLNRLVRSNITKAYRKKLSSKSVSRKKWTLRNDWLIQSLYCHKFHFSQELQSNTTFRHQSKPTPKPTDCSVLLQKYAVRSIVGLASVSSV